jgi:hypothetical protein
MNWGNVLDYVAHIDNTFHLTVWDRESRYDNSDLYKSDIFLLLTSDNSWHIDTKYLPSGCKRELNQALAAGKPIYIGYKTKAGTVAIYETSLTRTMLSGVAGTGGSIFRTHAPVEQPRTAREVEERVMEVEYEEPKMESIEYHWSDKRILLLL